jgi:serine/threonine protein kinase/tetratricopeptide (TPR) repeat protein
MATNNLEHIEDIFHAAVELVGPERAAYLARVCPEPSPLRLEVDSLISAHESGNDLFDHTAVTLAMKVIGSRSGDSMTGKQIGVYKVLSSLGKGGMGEVYLAEDGRLNRKVALKFLSSEFVTDSWAKRQLIREAQAVARLDHPNICAVYGLEEADEHSFIVMQYVEGQTLADLVRNQSIKTSQVIIVAQQMVSALAEAHAHGIIHRDIKPKNIMVTPSGQVKVLDFGLAKTIQKQQTFEEASESISQLSKSGLLVGTIAYMSPEQLRGEKLDYRSDIFSLGTVLYEMACGKNPYAHETNAEVISAIMRAEAQSLRQVATDCPKGLDRIVEKCSRKDRDNRYQSASELLIDLENLQKGIAPLPVKHTFLNVRYAALAALLLLCVVVVTFVYVNSTSAGHTLAILPIVCEGVESPTQCVGPTVTESLVKTLSRRSGLKVKPSRLEPSLYGPKAATPQRIGRDLNADTVFFGHIRRNGDDLVLHARLESVKDGSQIAEADYRFKPADLALLEQRLSTETAFNLQLPMNNDDKNVFAAVALNQDRKPKAYELYYNGRYFWGKRDRENLKKAVDFFNQAIDQDPMYALAYAGLADCYSLMNSVAYGSMSTREAMTKAEAAAKKAISLDDSLPEAHTAMAVVFMRYRWDWENAEKEFKRALALDPYFSPALQGYSVLLSITGRGPEAIAESSTAMDQDPLSPATVHLYCRALYLAGAIDQAGACYDRLAIEHPDYTPGKYIHGLVYIKQGRMAEAIQVFEEIYANNKAFGGALLGFCYGITNRRADAERILSEMQELAKQGTLPPQEIAIIYLGLDDRDHAYPLLRQAADEKFAPLQGVFIDPVLFERFRSDSRFIDLAKELKLPSHPQT